MPAPKKTCNQTLDVDGLVLVCQELAGNYGINHRMLRDQNSGLGLPHPIHTCNGWEWIASGRILHRPTPHMTKEEVSTDESSD